MRKEYQVIVEGIREKWGIAENGAAVEFMIEVAYRCQALADKPPKMLNLEEIERIFKDTTGSTPGRQSTAYAVAIEAAHIAKQKEPESVKLKIRIFLNSDGRYFAVSDDLPYCGKLIDSFEREVTI